MTDDRVERFRALYDESYPRVMAYVTRRARTRDDVEDVVSEVFTTAWRRFDSLPEQAVPWLFGVARRTLANHYRALDRKHRLQRRVESEPDTEPGEFDAIHEALDRLRPDDREILTLNAWDDLDSPEIAVVLGLPATTAAVRLHRAKKRFARELERSLKSESLTRTPDGVEGHHGEVTE
jgi:RNA polymerase sigma-70 factor (ECF subfamily)